MYVKCCCVNQLIENASYYNYSWTLQSYDTIQSNGSVVIIHVHTSIHRVITVNNMWLVSVDSVSMQEHIYLHSEYMRNITLRECAVL